MALNDSPATVFIYVGVGVQFANTTLYMGMYNTIQQIALFAHPKFGTGLTITVFLWKKGIQKLNFNLKQGEFYPESVFINNQL